jgi:hypothetical protein
VGDPVENNLLGRPLSFLNCVELRIPIQEDVQFRDLGDITAVDFPVDLNCELHSQILPTILKCRTDRQKPLRMLFFIYRQRSRRPR